MQSLQRLKLIGLIIFLSLPLSLQARECSNYERDKAEYYANLVAKEMVSNKYDGGIDISNKVISCNFNSYSDQFKIEIDTSFYGQFSGDYYNTQGIIIMDEDGSNRKYAETYANSTARDWKNIKNGFDLLNELSK